MFSINRASALYRRGWSSRARWGLSAMAPACLLLSVAGGPVMATEQILPAELLIPGDRFGYTLAADGDTIVVGAYGTGAGSAFVYERTGSEWLEVARLAASDGGNNDRFGRSVAIDGNTIVVGAFADDDRGTNAGAAYVFERVGTDWIESAKLLATDGVARDFFGISVSVDSNVAIVGSYRSDDSGSDSGSAYVFERTASGWVEASKLIADDGASGDRFGFSVSITDGLALVGSYLQDGVARDTGAAYIFENTASGWVQHSKLIAVDGAESDQFGISVAIDENVVAIGSFGDDDNGPTSGSVYIFEQLQGVWTGTQKLLAANGAAGDQFGRSISVNGNRVMAGSPYRDDNGTSSGAAYIFQKIDDSWQQQSYLLASDGVAQDNFGFSVSLDNDLSAVGSPGSESFTGGAHTFELLSDNDGDGDPDETDTDDDNDGQTDVHEIACGSDPLSGLSQSVDTDQDSLPDCVDSDDDNDNVADAEDAFPLDDAESIDTDGDGVGNNADTDDDDDNVADAEDAFPLDDGESLDTDGDGIGNNADTDDDNDNVADAEDAFPLDDGESLDSDSDGVGNNADIDDDNDGVIDSEDAFPLDALESLDTDGDSIGNIADTDDDGDGQLDSDELLCGSDPLSSASISLDLNGNSIPDCVELAATESPLDVTNSNGAITIALANIAEESLHVTSIDSSTLQLTYSQGGFVWASTVEDVRRHISILANQGVDGITFSDVVAPSSLFIGSGTQGELNLDLSNVEVAGLLRITGSTQNDDISLDNVSAQNVRVLGKSGSDEMVLLGVATSTLEVHTGTGNDSIEIGPSGSRVSAFSSMDLDMSADENKVAFNQIEVTNGVVLASGNGNDQWAITGSDFGASVSVSVRGGSDSVVVSDNRFDGRVIFRSGAGDDLMQSSNNNFFGEVYYNCGNGIDELAEDSQYPGTGDFDVVSCEQLGE